MSYAKVFKKPPTMICTLLRLLVVWSIVSARLSCGLVFAVEAEVEGAANLRITLCDSKTGEHVAGRVTVEQRPGGPHVYHFVKSLDPEGTAIPYDVTRGPGSFEKHTTVSAHPFGATVPPGMYVVYYAHGPEWRGNKAQVWVKEGEVAELELVTSRWIDMNKRGWYSGDTHVHRTVEELPNVMRAEDLNVALPLSYWIRDAYAPPALADKTFDKASGLITVDLERVIWPMNTEYELFTINGKTHTQGAVFVLNHKEQLTLPAPPVGAIAAEARQQSALLDLDKHSWPWSMMLVPVMDVDLFELANNHIWQTDFFFKYWPLEERPGNWDIETDSDGFTEWGWIDFGFKSYYALLNCGFKLRPSAGTANGVHPVPLGFGRVYVECPDGFSYENWIKNLDAGRSFVTTGPMLFVEVDGQPPGSTISVAESTTVRVHGSVEGIHSLSRIEIVKNGRVVDVIAPENVYESAWIHRSKFDVEIPIDGTSWIAVRCFEPHKSEPPWKIGFAHSAPFHLDMPGRPLRPRKIETDFFVRRMEDEIERNREILRPQELAEYEKARDVYARLSETASDEPVTTNKELRSLLIAVDQLSEGWKFTDISETELKVFDSNPIFFSHPFFLRGLPGGKTEDVERSNLLRVQLAFYNNPKTEQFACLAQGVCTDEASAKYVSEFMKAPPSMIGRFRTWHRGDVATWLMMKKGTADAEFEAFAGLVESRFPGTVEASD